MRIKIMINFLIGTLCIFFYNNIDAFSYRGSCFSRPTEREIVEELRRPHLEQDQEKKARVTRLRHARALGNDASLASRRTQIGNASPSVPMISAFQREKRLVEDTDERHTRLRGYQHTLSYQESPAVSLLQKIADGTARMKSLEYDSYERSPTQSHTQDTRLVPYSTQIEFSSAPLKVLTGAMLRRAETDTRRALAMMPTEVFEDFLAALSIYDQKIQKQNDETQEQIERLKMAGEQAVTMYNQKIREQQTTIDEQQAKIQEQQAQIDTLSLQQKEDRESRAEKIEAAVDTAVQKLARERFGFNEQALTIYPPQSENTTAESGEDKFIPIHGPLPERKKLSEEEKKNVQGPIWLEYKGKAKQIDDSHISFDGNMTFLFSRVSDKLFMKCVFKQGMLMLENITITVNEHEYSFRSDITKCIPIPTDLLCAIDKYKTEDGSTEDSSIIILEGTNSFNKVCSFILSKTSIFFGIISKLGSKKWNGFSVEDGKLYQYKEGKKSLYTSTVEEGEQ